MESTIDSKEAIKMSLTKQFVWYDFLFCQLSFKYFPIFIVKHSMLVFYVGVMWQIMLLQFGSQVRIALPCEKFLTYFLFSFYFFSFPLSLWKNSVGEESHLAIETSGHGALKENHWLDDGAYLMVGRQFQTP